jgi:hypothetical protein
MSIHHHQNDLPRHTAQGSTPNGTVAYSNASNEAFSGSRNHDGKFFTGYQWQCVEFARRWLWDQKGLMLPDIDIAAQIFFVPHMYDPVYKREVPVRSIRNGGTEKPTADTYLIYAPAIDNFPGHIAVITEVGDDYVYVADQNRDFRRWPGDYAVRFPLEHNNGQWSIIDKEDPILGWVEFPGVPNATAVTGSIADTWTDDDGVTHAKMRRPVPAGFDSIPDYSKQVKRNTFWNAMLSYRPHYAVAPFMIARIFAMLFYYQTKYAVRSLWNRWFPSQEDPKKAK